MRLDSLTSLRLPVGLPGATSRASRTVPLGDARLNSALGGGLRADGLHEFHAADALDAAGTVGFALLVAQLRRQDDGRPLIWARQADAAGLPYGPGLAELGIDPDALTLLALPDGKALLRAGLDTVRDGTAAAVLIELAGRQKLLDLTTTRRLALAAAESETMVLLARSGAEPTPSAAHTRWRVAAARSRPLPANAPGFPAFALTLLRQRGGREGLQTVLEWNRDTTSFHERPPLADSAFLSAPLHGAGPALAARRAAGS